MLENPSRQNGRTSRVVKHTFRSFFSPYIFYFHLGEARLNARVALDYIRETISAELKNLVYLASSLELGAQSRELPGFDAVTPEWSLHTIGRNFVFL